MYNPHLHFHFTGIGGSGMSGIAEVLLDLGFKVSGSDLKNSDVCRRLESLGARIFIGHAASNLFEDVSLLVYSSAVKEDNPEVVEAKRRGLPVIRRAEVLAELMRLKYGVAVAGSHGKTTTTSMIASVMELGGLDPTVIIGGQVKSLISGAKRGRSDFLVAESDESDRSFLLLKPTVAVVTNIDSEHLSAYSSLTDLEQSFEQFVSSVPFYGLAVLCIDDLRVRNLAEKYRGRKITYGLSPKAAVRAINISQKRNVSSFDVVYGAEKMFHVDLPIPGTHLLVNSLAAVAVGLEFAVPPEIIGEALSSFSGVKRRIETIGSVNGVTIINDYAHHPTEIRATLAAIRTGWKDQGGKVHVVFQPHRYSRTRDCFVEFLSAFSDADSLIITDIYSAGEDPIEGITAQILFDAVQHEEKTLVLQLEAVPTVLNGMIAPGDVIACLGAGSIGALPERLLSELSEGMRAA